MLTVKNLEDIRFELENAIQFETFKRIEEMIAMIDETIEEMQNDDTAMWDMLIECLDGCGDSGEAHFIKDKTRNVKVNDFEALKSSLNENELNFLERKLEDFLIEKDMLCERKEALIVTYLIDEFYI